MSMITRKHFYAHVEMEDGTLELDYIDTKITNMDLPTVRTWRIPQSMEFRPDLIAMKFLGNYDLGWLLALHNKFLDPIEDFKSGTLINIPDMDAYYRFYNTNAKQG